jgi:DNA primase
MIDTEQIRARADLVSIARSYGLHLRKMGAQFGALCPFHKEKTPSFYIHPGKQFYKCWGCDAEGDVFRFVQQMEGLPGFRETAQRVAELAGMPLTDEPWTPEQKQDYVRRREYARVIAPELEQFRIGVYRSLRRRLSEAQAAERQTRRWMLRHLDDDSPRVEDAWLAVVLLSEVIRITLTTMEQLRDVDPDRIAAIYLELRTPALVAALSVQREIDEKFAALSVALLSASSKDNLPS